MILKRPEKDDGLGAFRGLINIFILYAFLGALFVFACEVGPMGALLVGKKWQDDFPKLFLSTCAFSM